MKTEHLFNTKLTIGKKKVLYFPQWVYVATATVPINRYLNAFFHIDLWVCVSWEPAVCTVSTIFTEGFVPVITAGLCVRAACASVVWLFLRQLCPVIGQTHTAASPRALSLSLSLSFSPSPTLPPHPTWHSCQRHGSVPWHATCHLPGTSSGCGTERWDCANWGYSDHRGCPLFGCLEGGFPTCSMGTWSAPPVAPICHPDSHHPLTVLWQVSLYYQYLRQGHTK